jgi:hypothetical protein
MACPLVSRRGANAEFLLLLLKASKSFLYPIIRYKAHLLVTARSITKMEQYKLLYLKAQNNTQSGVLNYTLNIAKFSFGR